MVWGPYHHHWRRPLTRKDRPRCLHCQLHHRRNDISRVPIYATDRILQHVTQEHERLWQALGRRWCSCDPGLEMRPSNSPHLLRLKRERWRP